MPTQTYIPLANLTLGASAASVTFSSISQAYRDLVLVVTGTSTTGNVNTSLRFNADSSASYNDIYALGDGTSVSSTYDLNAAQLTAGDVFNTVPGIATFNILDYSATDKHKPVLCRTSVANSTTTMLAGRWANTAAITTILVRTSINAFAANSNFALYGIVA